MADILVRLVAGDDEERSFFLSQELSSDIARLSGVVSHPPPAVAPEPGQRGDPITLGAIIIAAVGGGGALTALVSTIGSYLARDRRTEVEVATPDGHKVRISSQAFNHKELEELLRRSLPTTGE
jgi:Effector Associated Constant Component 1